MSEFEDKSDALGDIAHGLHRIAYGTVNGPTGLELVAMALAGNSSEENLAGAVRDGFDSLAGAVRDGFDSLAEAVRYAATGEDWEERLSRQLMRKHGVVGDE